MSFLCSSIAEHFSRLLVVDAITATLVLALQSSDTNDSDV